MRTKNGRLDNSADMTHIEHEPPEILLYMFVLPQPLQHQLAKVRKENQPIPWKTC